MKFTTDVTPEYLLLQKRKESNKSISLPYTDSIHTVHNENILLENMFSKNGTTVENWVKNIVPAVCFKHLRMLEYEYFSALGKVFNKRKVPSTPIEIKSTNTIRFSNGNSSLNALYKAIEHIMEAQIWTRTARVYVTLME